MCQNLCIHSVCARRARAVTCIRAYGIVQRPTPNLTSLFLYFACLAGGRLVATALLVFFYMAWFLPTLGNLMARMQFIRVQRAGGEAKERPWTQEVMVAVVAGTVYLLRTAMLTKPTFFQKQNRKLAVESVHCACALQEHPNHSTLTYETSATEHTNSPKPDFGAWKNGGNGENGESSTDKDGTCRNDFQSGCQSRRMGGKSGKTGGKWGEMVRKWEGNGGRARNTHF